MCGIAGILALTGGAPAARPELERMIHTLRHRGPDGFGYYQSGPIGFAHARLSIIDLTTGDQPMSNADGSLWTVFNGEIFNYLELRTELQRAGYVFRTSSDTETILHAYAEYGDEFVHRLNGQFAIALWDAKRQRLLLARDRVGIRPLFVQRDGRRVLFASEVKALRAVSSRPSRLSLEGLAQIFTFWGAIGEQTAFEGVRSVPPGHILSIEGDEESLTKYWGWDFPHRGGARVPS